MLCFITQKSSHLATPSSLEHKMLILCDHPVRTGDLNKERWHVPVVPSTWEVQVGGSGLPSTWDTLEQRNRKKDGREEKKSK